MYIIECLPFSKGLNKDSLSYFSSKEIEPGSLVKVNIRNKSVNALVIESKNATESKTELKRANFQLKKIISLNSKPFLQKEFLEAVKITAKYFVTNQGNILSHLIPSFVLENPSILSLPKGTLELSLSQRVPLGNSMTALGNPDDKTKSEVAVLQVPDEEKFIHYRSLIREEFAKKKSVFLCLSKNQDIKQAKEKLERGIENFVYAFHNELNKKELKKKWQGASKTTHPILIIATAQWLFLPRNDFGTIIIDRENENGWKTLSKPFIDLRFFAEILANKKNIRIAIIGGWATFFYVDNTYSKAFGKNYMGSRDIDISFDHSKEDEFQAIINGDSFEKTYSKARDEYYSPVTKREIKNLLKYNPSYRCLPEKDPASEYDYQIAMRKYNACENINTIKDFILGFFKPKKSK